MLQVLSDLFLLISNDGNKITNKDISIFYNFIIKKMPMIEQQYPSMIVNSLKIPSQNIDDKNKNGFNDFKNSKDSKKLFIYFQEQIINLFNDLIDFCYNEGIIKLNEKVEKLIKTKIDDKIKEKNDKKNGNSSKFNYNVFYQKEMYIKKAKREEIRNFLIFLIINGDINFNIYPNNYIKFFNSDKKIKNRTSAGQFMKFIKNFIEIYKENKKEKNKRINNKINNTAVKNINRTERKNDNRNNNKIEEKTNKTDGKNSSNGIKSLNTEIKKIDLNRNNNKVKEKINTNLLKKERNKLSSKNSYNQIRYLTNKADSSKKKSLNRNRIIKKITPLSEQSIIINDDSNIEEDEINDTIRCETPKNISKESENESKTKINLGKIFLKNDKNQRGYSADKTTKANQNIRLTISAVPTKISNKIRESDDNSSFKRFTYAINQKDNANNRNKNNNKDSVEAYIKYHKSFINNDVHHLKNIKEKTKILKDKTKPINKSQSIVHKDMFIDNILNTEKTNKNKNNYESENNRRIKENVIFDYFDSEKYNVVRKVSKDNNNNQFKELYLYDNNEVHQHLVIFNDKEKGEEKETENNDDNMICNIF